jgi:riboflavin kinase / FMN adenylyltransferase
MKVFNSFENLGEIQNPVLTIGTFDGVHIGHQKIIQQINQEADKLNGESVLLTFYPHPRIVLNPKNHGLSLIQTQKEKLKKLERFGLKNVIVIPFTPEFANLSAEDFVLKYLVEKLKVKNIVIGYDHQFGKNREGGVNFLNKLSVKHNFQVTEIPAQEINDVNISSTRIRKAIENGEIDVANEYLGETFSFDGEIVKGKQLGRTIGFPTANIKILDTTKIIPSNGVYQVSIEIKGTKYYGMMNIGERPTVSDSGIKSIEVNIFDFNDEIYGEIVAVCIFEKVRNEIKFDSIDDLKNQLIIDEKHCYNLISTIK